MQCSSFDNVSTLIFCAFWLEMPIHAHFGFLRPLDPEMGSDINKIPKRHIFAWKDIV